MLRTDINPASVSDIIAFPDITYERLQELDSANNENSRSVYGRISDDGTWAYLINGSYLEITSTFKGSRISACRFTNSTRNKRPLTITCAKDFGASSADHTKPSEPKLLLGLDNGFHGGFLCLFGIKSSKIIKCIEIPYTITALEVLCTFGGLNANNNCFNLELRCMFGSVAVGTKEGHLYLVDLCLDENVVSTLSNPGHLYQIDSDNEDLYDKREACLREGLHLCLALNEAAVDQICFRLANSDGSILYKISPDRTAITSLKFLNRTSTLAVGFSFGGFTLWNLNRMQIDESQFDRDKKNPVVSFAFQEPENDPKPFVYLWVARGVLPSSGHKNDIVSTLCLYAMKYMVKHTNKSNDYWYEDLKSCSLKFEHELLCDPLYQEMARESRILSCVAIHKDATTRSDQGQDHGALNLMIVSWEAWSAESDNCYKAFIGVFDLNQWYQAQMPETIRISRDFCPFFGGFSLEEILEKTTPDFILDVNLNPNSILPFQKREVHELHFYPSSLAFGVSCLSPGGIINVSYLGLQRQILLDLQQTGSEIIFEPQDALKVCVYGGLIKPIEKTSSLITQRETLLSLCLEYNMFNIINGCATNIGNRNKPFELSSNGGALRFILEWVWKTSGQIKNAADKLIVQLFNQSGMALDSAQCRELQQHIEQVDHLAMILRSLTSQNIAVTHQGFRELEAKTNAITLVHTYYRIIEWFHQIGLIPLRKEDGSGENFEIPFEQLTEWYQQRRRVFQRISVLISGTDLLLIDGIVAQIAEPLSRVWDKVGRTVHYPPPNLYSLLNIVLLDEVNMMTKHKIILYFLLDVISCLADDKHDQLSAELMSYTSTFSLPPSVVRVTRGFWLLDHRDFDGALPLLTHPFVTVCDIDSWQNTMIVKSLLYQGEHKKALRYWERRQPTMTSPDDMKLYLSVLLVNVLVIHAYQFLGRCRDKNIAKDLLNHFFLGCLQTRHLKEVIDLPLTEQEQQRFVEFLRCSDEPYAQDILVMYFLQRSQFQQAFQLNEKLKSNECAETDASKRERSNIRNQIVNGYVKVLPKVQQELITNSKMAYSALSDRRGKPCLKPQPLSTLIKPCNMELVSQSTLIEAVLQKISETSTENINDSSRNRDGKSFKCDNEINSMPFLCTPITPRRDRTRDPCEVVYPEIKEMEGDSPSTELMASPSKRSRFIDITPPSKRRGLKHVNAELNTLLQMPPLRRKTPQRSPISSSASVFITPQSILKVRNMLTNAASTSSPTVHSESAIFSEGVQEQGMSEEPMEIVKPSTPVGKQLRFAEPESPEVTSESPEFHMKKFPEGEIVLSSPLEAKARPPIHSSQSSLNTSAASDEASGEFFFSPPLETSLVNKTKSAPAEPVFFGGLNEPSESQDQSVDEIMSATSDDNNELNLDSSDSISIPDEDDNDTKRSGTRLSSSSSIVCSSVSWQSTSMKESPGGEEERPESPTPSWVMDILEKDQSFDFVDTMKTAEEDAEKIASVDIGEETTEKTADKTLTYEDIVEEREKEMPEQSFRTSQKKTPASKPSKVVKSERRTSLRLSAKKNSSPEIVIGNVEKAKKALYTKSELVYKPAQRVGRRSRLSNISESLQSSPNVSEKGRKSNFTDDSSQPSPSLSERGRRSRLSDVSESSQQSSVSTERGERQKKTRRSRRISEHIEFSFSEPDVLPTAALAPLSELEETPSQDVKPFVFSPPLTRSKSKKVKPKSDIESEGSPKRKAVRKKTKGRASEALVSNSPINFISPAVTSGQAYSLRSKDVDKVKKTKAKVKLQKK